MSMALPSWLGSTRSRSPWGHRVICGQVEAKPCDRPLAIPFSRPRGSKGAGLRYERAFAKVVPGILHGPWFAFSDANGKGHCQPDFVWVFPRQVVVFETKLTDTPAGRAQIIDLYAPVLCAVYYRPVAGIIVCKNLTKDTDLSLVTDSLETALARAESSIPILHWLGNCAL